MSKVNDVDVGKFLHRSIAVLMGGWSSERDISLKELSGGQSAILM